MITQQAQPIKTTQEHTEYPHTRATVEGVEVEVEPMSARPAPFGGASQEVPRRLDSDMSEAEYEAQKVK